MIYEVEVPIQAPATITPFADRTAWQRAVERAAETTSLEPFILHRDGCTGSDDDDDTRPCVCPVDWEAVAAEDLHAWFMVDRQTLCALAAGLIRLTAHQALRLQHLAQTTLASSGEEEEAR